MLKNLNLEFIGFTFPDKSFKRKFIKLFPEDKDNISLYNWGEFEKRNPDTFAQMYHFWVRKNK